MALIRYLIGIFTMGCALALAQVGAATAADTIVLGMPVKPPPMVHLPVYYALDNGLFKKRNLDVEVKFFRGGVATHRAAASAQSGLDAAWVPAPIAMSGISRGSGLKIFHSMAFRFEAQLAAAPGIDSPKMLRGRRIGIEGRGGYSHLGALSVMGPAGLTDADVKYVKTPPPARVPFLVGKKVDAVLIHVEQTMLAQKMRPGVKKLADLWVSRPYYMYGVFIAPAKKLSGTPSRYARFAAAMMESTRAIYKDKAGYLKTAAKWIKPVYKKYPGLTSATYDTFVNAKIWSVNNGLPRKWIDWTNRFNVELKKYKGAAPSYDDLVDSNVAEWALKLAGPVSPAED